ncbi:MAG: hypothetical protein D3924_15110 [Candidatus Electrothrix sp. AR4]|nr:hypothetical protein [Candidatus Electrothrix sp. AR4]
MHILACIPSSVVFHWSIHHYMPHEATGPDVPIWGWPLELIFIPLRIVLAIAGSLFGGSITLAQHPFANITATYFSIVLFLSIVWAFFTHQKSGKGAL